MYDLMGGDSEHNAQVNCKFFNDMQGAMTDAIMLNAVVGAKCTAWKKSSTAVRGRRVRQLGMASCYRAMS